ncbi:NADH-quinone oxidoreductase subunit NuoG [Geotalea uraniireducens]|uniref:NADH-quinone oxidoreductase n=1 Tax=Geotalea uraniireducens (strain Rf4) TaxID=351605 RepID=A5GD08_GEOUR|nr:NADH-quinone oxidoreductase subunit NuoG [Geotalea uraniireducens]ABQ24542.1 NADH dehydrogenase subunit G [Geotalea uraniireducens Rf4]
MPKLTIDNITVEVPPGTNVLEAAKQVGIWIPHFCYHPALGSVGACRLCAMKFLEGPVKGVQMSCMIPAQDGMVVSTTDGEAARMRQMVIEWLMLNHPHDCPVCDEGGECLLQDYTVAGGHGNRRYRGKKRTHTNQYLGPYIEHEMNRCIQCYRCVRFYQEYAGGSDFGVMGSAARVYYGRFSEGELESPFSGNLVDICPTGVFTDKTARFRARYWDYDMAPSVCPHCSLGCNTIPAARYRELLKTMARRNDAVNGWFICDKGRFGNSPVNDPKRPRTPLIDGTEASWEAALDALVLRLGEVLEIYGEGSIAVVGSPRLALEGNALLPILAACADGGVLSFFADAGEADRTATAVSLLNRDNAAGMADVQAADAVVIMGGDLLEEGPMMALAVRQAWRKGARLFMVGGDGGVVLTKTLGLQVTPLTSLAAAPLTEFRNPVIVCGTSRAALDEIEVAAGAGAKLACLLSGPNAFAAAMLSREHGAPGLSQAIAGGTIRGIIAFEADIPPELLADIPFVAAADWLPTETVKQAQIFLPTTAWVEMEGTFINNEGRAQRFKQVMQPGLPIKGLDPALHPPRVHGRVAPGSDVRPAWQVIDALIERLGGERIVEPLGNRWEKLHNLDPEGGGTRVL